MASKKEQQFNRLELAAYLEALANKLRQGSFKVQGQNWTVPEIIDTKIRFKEKKGTFTTKLTWRWSSLVDYAEQDRQKVADWKKQIKFIKKKMGQTFKVLKNAIQEERIPDQTQLLAFSETIEAFSKYAEPEWQDAMEEFRDHLRNLERAARAQDLKGVQHEMRDLQHRMVDCHKDFK